MEQNIENEPKRKSPVLAILLVIILVIILAGGYYFFILNKDNSAQPAQNTSTKENNQTSQSQWQEKGVAISGKYADSEVVDLGDGKYRMYYSVEPEVTGNNLEIFSATSSDGQTWTKESGTRKTMATFPDVVKLPDGKWRMYYQNAGIIKSAASTDGLAWTDEPGTRMDRNETGYNLESVGAQSTIIQSDGTYVMLYRGTINQPYQTTEKIPNQNTQLYFWATSKDGLTFEKKGLAIDSRNDILYGLADGAEWVKWNNSEQRVYFWSYAGIYHTVYKNGTFSSPVFNWTNIKNSKAKFAPNPPGDPTIIKINNTWYMYYGQHTKGIYYATLISAE